MPPSLRQALRSLRRTPVFALTASLTLVLGMGSVGAMFAVAWGVLLKPLPYGRPDRLVSLALETSSPELRRMLQPSAAYFTYRRFARRLEDLGFFRSGNANIWNGESDPERVSATWITPFAIRFLGVSAIVGRTYFTADEEAAQGPQAVILSESVWRSRFGAARDVVGKTLYANSVARVVVGVMPAAFHFPAADTRVWLPAKLGRDSAYVGDFSYSGVARLKDAVTPEQARADLASALPHLAELYPLLESGSATSEWLAEARPRPAVLTLRDEVSNGIARTLWILLAAAASCCWSRAPTWPT